MRSDCSPPSRDGAFSPPAITQLLRDAAKGGEPARQVLPMVYDELRRLAAARLRDESPGHTLSATALVHEAYVRLLGADGDELNWDSRGHFFAAAAQAMRRILIDHARARDAAKRRPAEGGARRALSLSRMTADAVTLSLEEDPAALLDLDAALDALHSQDPTKAQLVALRFFAGLSLDQAARAMGVSPATADRHWAYARAWLFDRLADEHKNPG